MYFKFATIIFFGLVTSSAAVAASCLDDLPQVLDQARGFYARGQYLLAATQFSNYSLLVCSKDRQDAGRLGWAKSLYELGESVEAELVLDALSPKTANEGKIIKAWYQADYISSLSQTDQQRFSHWQREIRELPRVKTPWVAGSLSALLPGAGQVYNGNYQSAAFSFILNALFLTATLSFMDQHMDGAAITSGMLFSVVYVGAISGSARDARLLNEMAQKEGKESLRKKYFPELEP